MFTRVREVVQNQSKVDIFKFGTNLFNMSVGEIQSSIKNSLLLEKHHNTMVSRLGFLFQPPFQSSIGQIIVSGLLPATSTIGKKYLTTLWCMDM